MSNNIMDIDVWQDTESISTVAITVSGEIWQAIEVAKNVARALGVWHLESVGIRVNNVDLARWLVECNQEVSLW